MDTKRESEPYFMKTYTRSDLIQDITWVQNLIRRCGLENEKARKELIKDLKQESMFFSFLGKDFLEFMEYSGDAFKEYGYQKDLLHDLDLLKEFLRLHYLEYKEETLLEFENFKKQKPQYRTWIGKSFETYMSTLCQSILEEKRKTVQKKQSSEIYEIEKLSRDYDLNNQWDVDKLYETLNQSGEDEDKTRIWEQFMDGLWENTTEKKEAEKKVKAANRGMRFFVIAATLILILSAFLTAQIIQNKKMNQMLAELKKQTAEENRVENSNSDLQKMPDGAGNNDVANNMDSSQENEDTSKQSEDPQNGSTNANPQSNSNSQLNSNMQFLPILPELQAMYANNRDMMGWLSIADTTVDYPVMQNMQDDAYYLSHNYFKEENSSGAIFLSAKTRVTPLDNFVVIYGHNMKGDNMFGALKHYSAKSYLDSHPTFEFDTLFEKNEYDIVAVVRTQVKKEGEDGFRYYQYFNYETEEDFAQIQSFVEQNLLYETGKQLSYGDSIVILSTCDTSEENGRLLVVGVKK